MLKLIGGGGERSARLAEKLAVARPTLTSTADSLVAAGLAVRQAEPGDRRVVRLCLTPAGQAAVERADEAYAAWFGSLLDDTGRRAEILAALQFLDDSMTERWRARQAAGRRPGQAHGRRPAQRQFRSQRGPAVRRGTSRNPLTTAGPAQTGPAQTGPAQTGPAQTGQAASTLGSGYGEGWLRRLVANCWRHKTLSLVAFGASLVATLVTACHPADSARHHRQRDPDAQAGRSGQAPPC